MKKLRAKLALVCLMLAITVGIASMVPAYADPCGPQGGTDSSKQAPKMPPDVAAQIVAAVLAAMSVL